MQYSDDPNFILFEDVENAMSAVHQTTVVLAIFGCRWARERIIPQKRKFLVEAVHVSLAEFVTELRKTVFVDCTQICNGGIRKRNVSHALLAVGR